MNYGTDDYDLFDDEPSGFARWAMPALIISLLLHAVLFFWFRNVPLHASLLSAPPPPPRTFRLERPKIDPKILQPQVAEKPQPAAAPRAVKLPKEKPEFGSMMAETRAVPAAPEIKNPMLADRPKVDATSFERTVQDAERGGVKSVAGELDQIRPDLLADKPGVNGKPLLEIARPDADSGASPSRIGDLAGGTAPGFSNLDDLLAQTGPLTKETAPIKMDGDVLYAYDSYQIDPGAIASLQKLGTIIQRNPQLAFSIEGHSDSSGSESYNLQLSRLRAEAVKAWLVQAMGVDPVRVTTQGFGSTRLLVPATQPFDETVESPNRRVEIVIHDRVDAPQ